MSDEVLPTALTITMKRLEAVRRVAANGSEFWMARDIGPILGYLIWGNFEVVVKRASVSMKKSGRNPSLHFKPTQRTIETKNRTTPNSRDFYLSRFACYLIAMNGEPSKPEIADAQVYFATQTRRMEESDAISSGPKSDDLKRLTLRDKVTTSMKRVSSVAQNAGVRNHRQGLFHDQRYIGLYGARTVDVYQSKGLTAKDVLFDRAGPLELSAHEFQMNLAANIIEKEKVMGEESAISKNLEVAKKVRKAIQDSGGTLPENLPLVEHISDVRKRITGRRTKSSSTSLAPTASQQLPLLSPLASQESNS